MFVFPNMLLESWGQAKTKWLSTISIESWKFHSIFFSISWFWRCTWLSAPPAPPRLGEDWLSSTDLRIPAESCWRRSRQFPPSHPHAQSPSPPNMPALQIASTQTGPSLEKTIWGEIANGLASAWLFDNVCIFGAEPEGRAKTPKKQIWVLISYSLFKILQADTYLQ